MVAELLGVARGGSDAQTLLTDRDGRVVDALDVDLVVGEELVGRLLSQLGVADEDGDDVAGVGDDGDVTLVESLLDGAGVQLLEAAVTVVAHLVLNGGAGTSHDGGRKGGGKDEAGSERADGVDQLGAAGNVATDAAVGLAEGAGEDVDAVGDGSLGLAALVGLPVKVLSDTGAVWAVHADGMHFIVKGDGTVLLGQVANLLNGTDGSAHAVH